MGIDKKASKFKVRSNLLFSAVLRLICTDQTGICHERFIVAYDIWPYSVKVVGMGPKNLVKFKLYGPEERHDKPRNRHGR